MTNTDVVVTGLVMAIAGLVAASVWVKQPTRRTSNRRLPPWLLLPSDPEAAWTQAPVPRSQLQLGYREESGSLTNCIVHPRSIRGELVGENRIRPSILNAFCETEQGMRAFRIDRIERAADTLSSEFIDDLYTYLCSAQPGGAPARIYAPVGPSTKSSKSSTAILKR